MPLKKRIFDLTVCLLAAPILLPALVLCCLAIRIFDGAPAFYVSTRRIYKSQSARIPKFRAMVRNADVIANRFSIPVTGQRFLNIPFESPLYTPIGRLFEKCCLTELPQVVHVLTGKMSLVGNRPLPENVVEALLEVFPDVESRFELPAGLTGPVQLVGRMDISDLDRLRLEITYCEICANSYRMKLDFNLLFFTVLTALHIRPCMTVDEVAAAMSGWAGRKATADRHPD